MSEKFVGATNTLLRGNKGVRKDKRFIKKKRKNEGERRKKGKTDSILVLL